MTDRGPQGYTLIGLHKLAAHDGGGMVPELLELLMEREERRERYPNIEPFPIWEARKPGALPAKPLGRDALDGRNVIAFEFPEAERKRKA